MAQTLRPSFGADIGGTAVKVGRLDGSGNPSGETSIPTRAASGPAELAAALVQAWRGLLSPGESLESIPLGIGCAGLIDGERGRVVTSPNLPGWRDEPLVERVLRDSGRTPLLMNDANAFVLAEGRLGAGAELPETAVIVGLSLGTGVGGAIQQAGRLLLGAHGFAGEPGHMVIALDGPPCACGGRGCLEALIGTKAIQERYRASGGSGHTPAPEEISRLAAAGDPAARATWEETGRILGVALASLTHLLDPDLFILGGGVASAGEPLLAPARRALADASFVPASSLPPVVPARLGNSAGWMGAALAAQAVGS